MTLLTELILHVYLCVTHYLPFLSYFFLLHSCQWLETRPVVLLGCCRFRVSTPPAAGLPCNVWGSRGLPGPTARVWGGGAGGKCWCKGSSGVHWGPACHIFAVESAKHRNCLKPTLMQSHSPLILFFVLGGRACAH